MLRASTWIARFAVVVGLCMHVPTSAGAEPKAMNKQDWKPPIFVTGPHLEPHAELTKWLQQQQAHGQMAVKLPFTIWFGPSPLEQLAHVAIGLRTEPRPHEEIALNDSALGRSLRDHLRTLCPVQENTRCAVWLSGRFTQPHTFSIYAVHDALPLTTDPTTLRAEVERSKQCLVIRMQSEIHCARGVKRCEKCRAAAAKPAVPRLLDVCPEGDYARPTILLSRDGKRQAHVFDVVRSFTDAEDAHSFATKHGIADVQLDTDAE